MRLYSRSHIIIFIALLVIISVGNIVIEVLTNCGYAASEIMTVNSGLSFLMMAGYTSMVRKESLRIRNLKLQISRVVLNGLSMYLIFRSFSFLAAGTVAMVQRLDIAVLIIISSITQGTKSSLQFYLSIWIVLLISFFIINSGYIDEDIRGYPFIIFGVVASSIGYQLMKKQTGQESAFSLGTFYSLGLMVWGGIFGFATGEDFAIATNDLWIFGLGGLVQFSIVILVLHLYKHYSVELARLPFVLAVFGTLALEMIVEQKLFSLNQIVISALITGMICTVCINPQAPKISKEKN